MDTSAAKLSKNFCLLFSQSKWKARIVKYDNTKFTIQVGVASDELESMLLYIRDCGVVHSGDWTTLEKAGFVNLVARGIYETMVDELIAAIQADMREIGYKFDDEAPLAGGGGQGGEGVEYIHLGDVSWKWLETGIPIQCSGTSGGVGHY